MFKMVIKVIEAGRRRRRRRRTRQRRRQRRRKRRRYLKMGEDDGLWGRERMGLLSLHPKYNNEEYNVRKFVFVNSKLS